MTTKFIGVRALRQNMATILKSARSKKQRLIILRKNEPIFELRPISKKNQSLEKLLLSIEEAREDIKNGNVFTQEEIEKEFGLV